MTTFQKLLFCVWLMSIVAFFLILVVLAGPEPINDFWSNGLLIIFVIGVLSFLSIFLATFIQRLLSSVILFTQKISKKMVITFSIVLTIFLLIYWFQLRPARIKSACSLETKEKSSGKNWTMKQFDFAYTHCLHRNGL